MHIMKFENYRNATQLKCHFKRQVESGSKTVLQAEKKSTHFYLFCRACCLLGKFKNGGRGTTPTYIFMVIIPLLVIELKATPNGNPSDDFYWRQKSSSLNVVRYNTTSRPIIIHL